MPDKSILFNPENDLVLERTVEVSPEKLWLGYTKPEYLKKWFAPLPWTIADCRIDPRPGGEFMIVMKSPEGKEFPMHGTYLEVVPNQKLVTTDTLLAGYRPSENPFFTAVITFERTAKGTLFKAVAMHKNAEIRKQHEDMGFHQGWGQCLDQLVSLSKTIKV